MAACELVVRGQRSCQRVAIEQSFRTGCLTASERTEPVEIALKSRLKADPAGADCEASAEIVILVEIGRFCAKAPNDVGNDTA